MSMAIDLQQDNHPGSQQYWRELQQWLLDEEEPERERLSREIESPYDPYFYSAALELFLTHTFRQRGWVLQRHPQVPGTKRQPDYGVNVEGNEFYVEAKVTVGSQNDVDQEARLRDLIDVFNEFSGPYRVWLQLLSEIPGDFSQRRLRAFLRQTLGNLGSVPEVGTIAYADPQWAPTLRFRLEIHASDDAGPILGMVSRASKGNQIAAVTINTHEAIKQAVDEKISRYGNPEKLFVICVYPKTKFPVTQHAVYRALFGTQSWNFRYTPGGLQNSGTTVSKDGIFTGTNESGDPVRTRLSAVGIYKQKITDSGSEHDFVIFHNPFATRQIDPALLAGIPQLVPVAREVGTLRFEWRGTPPSWLIE